MLCENNHITELGNLLDLDKKGILVYFSGSLNFCGKEIKLCKEISLFIHFVITLGSEREN